MGIQQYLQKINDYIVDVKRRFPLYFELCTLKIGTPKIGIYSQTKLLCNLVAKLCASHQVRFEFSEEYSEYNMMDMKLHRELAAFYECFQDLNIGSLESDALLLEISDKEFVFKEESSTEDKYWNNLNAKSIGQDQDENITYYVFGDKQKETLFIINAVAQSLSFWNNFIAIFGKEYRIIVWQERSKVNKRGISKHYSINTHLNDIETILNHEDIKSCTLLAWCTGGKLLFKLYAMIPQRVSAMIFLTCAFKGAKGTEELVYKYEKNLEFLCNTIVKYPDRAAVVCESIKSNFSRKFKMTSEVINDQRDDLDRYIFSLPVQEIRSMVLEPYLDNENVLEYAKQLIEYWKIDFEFILPQINIPVLFFSGEYDDIASPEMSKEISSRISDSQYYEVERGNHYLVHEKANEISRIIRAFINK